MLWNQSAFIKDRLLLENVLLATELVKDYLKDLIRNAKVCDVIRGNECALRRSRNAKVQEIISHLRSSAMETETKYL